MTWSARCASSSFMQKELTKARRPGVTAISPRAGSQPPPFHKWNLINGRSGLCRAKLRKSKGITVRKLGATARNTSPASRRRDNTSAICSRAAWRCGSGSMRAALAGYTKPLLRRLRPPQEQTAPRSGTAGDYSAQVKHSPDFSMEGPPTKVSNEVVEVRTLASREVGGLCCGKNLLTTRTPSYKEACTLRVLFVILCPSWLGRTLPAGPRYCHST
jgi:hypothetical protein